MASQENQTPEATAEQRKKVMAGVLLALMIFVFWWQDPLGLFTREDANAKPAAPRVTTAIPATKTRRWLRLDTCVSPSEDDRVHVLDSLAADAHPSMEALYRTSLARGMAGSGARTTRSSDVLPSLG